MISFSKDIDIPFPNFTNVINDGQISKLSVVYLIVPKCYRSVQRLLHSSGKVAAVVPTGKIPKLCSNTG